MRVVAWALSLAILDLRIPPLPPPERPPADHSPATATLERDAGVADRFAGVDGRVAYTFASEKGELALFSLETFGYARGWRSTGRIRVLDEAGRVLVDESRTGPSVWHQLTPFVAPEAGQYRYELSTVDQCFRYRLVRHASYVARTGDEPTALGSRERIQSYLAAPSDVARFTLELDLGEEVFLKVSNSDEGGVAERRSFHPPRLGDGSIGGFVYPTFVFSVSVDDLDLVTDQRSLLLRAPRAGTYHVRVSAHAPGAAGRFELDARRRVAKIALWGTVRDRDDAPRPGARLTIFHGIDRDVVGAVRTADDGSFRIDVPPGRLRIRLEGSPEATEIDLVAETGREVTLVP